MTVNALHPGVVQTELSRSALYFLTHTVCFHTPCGGHIRPAKPHNATRLGVPACMQLDGLDGVIPCRYLIGDSPPWWQVPLLSAASLFLKTPAQGAATSIYLASSPEMEGVSSKYYADCRPLASSKASYDAGVARRLWEVSQELTGAEVDAAVPVLS